jgi:hypothetical protein
MAAVSLRSAPLPSMGGVTPSSELPPLSHPNLSTPLKLSSRTTDAEKSCCKELMAKVIRAVLHFLLAIRDFFKDLFGISSGKEILMRHPALVQMLQAHNPGDNTPPIIDAFDALYPWQRAKIAEAAYLNYTQATDLQDFDPSKDISLTSAAPQLNLMRLKELVTAQDG